MVNVVQGGSAVLDVAVVERLTRLAQHHSHPHPTLDALISLPMHSKWSV